VGSEYPEARSERCSDVRQVQKCPTEIVALGVEVRVLMNLRQDEGFSGVKRRDAILIADAFDDTAVTQPGPHVFDRFTIHPQGEVADKSGKFLIFEYLN